MGIAVKRLPPAVGTQELRSTKIGYLKCEHSWGVTTTPPKGINNQ